MNHMDKRIQQRLFPAAPRDFPGRRFIRSALRSIHILGGGVLIGAYLFEQNEAIIHTWLLTATLSGLLLFATDLHASFAIFCEWRGLAVIAKISLLLVIPFLPGLAV